MSSVLSCHGDGGGDLFFKIKCCKASIEPVSKLLYIDEHNLVVVGHRNNSETSVMSP